MRSTVTRAICVLLDGIQSYCRFNPTAVKEHPDNCAQYFDCSKPTSPLGPYLMECDYPKLFSSLLGTCADFETVQCGQKTEPRSPCKNIGIHHEYSCRIGISNPRDQKVFASVTRLCRVTWRKVLSRWLGILILHEKKPS